MNATTFPYTGQPLKRREDFKFLTGKGRYVDDIKLPGMLHVAIARSPHAHAIIRNVDLSSAKTAPGVRLALAGKDLGDKIGPIVPNWILPGTKVPFRPVVATDRVRFVGECVALVVAETLAEAYDAVGLIDVEYEALPAVTDEAAAILENAPQLHENVPGNVTTIYKVRGGDYATAAREADQVIRLCIANNRLIPTCMETRSVIAVPDPDGPGPRRAGQRLARLRRMGGNFRQRLVLRFCQIKFSFEKFAVLDGISVFRFGFSRRFFERVGFFK